MGYVMFCGRFGKTQITDEQKREARRIILDARTQFGTKKAAKEIGIAIGTFSSIASGATSAGSYVYAKAKKYDNQQKQEAQVRRRVGNYKDRREESQTL